MCHVDDLVVARLGMEIREDSPPGRVHAREEGRLTNCYGNTHLAVVSAMIELAASDAIQRTFEVYLPEVVLAPETTTVRNTGFTKLGLVSEVEIHDVVAHRSALAVSGRTRVDLTITVRDTDGLEVAVANAHWRVSHPPSCGRASVVTLDVGESVRFTVRADDEGHSHRVRTLVMRMAGTYRLEIVEDERFGAWSAGPPHDAWQNSYVVFSDAVPGLLLRHQEGRDHPDPASAVAAAHPSVVTTPYANASVTVAIVDQQSNDNQGGLTFRVFRDA